MKKDFGGDILAYENRLGKVYHFRAKKTKLGKTTYVASTKSSPDEKD